jgi:hypothetical protein
MEDSSISRRCGQLTTPLLIHFVIQGISKMPSFERMFMESGGKSVEYQGNTLVMVDLFPVEDGVDLRLTFESCSGEWRQGVSLKVVGNGKIDVNGQQLTHAVFWQDTAPRTVTFKIVGDVTAIEVKNVWDTGDGVAESWHNGAAMIVDADAAQRTYRCNDGYADDDFDDIIFRIERLE